MDPYSEDHGLVFRSFVYLFKVLQEHENCNFVLKASFLEIYNEKVFLFLSLFFLSFFIDYSFNDKIMMLLNKNNRIGFQKI